MPLSLNCHNCMSLTETDNYIVTQVKDKTPSETCASRTGEMPPPMDVRDCKASWATLLAPIPGDGIEPGWIGATLPEHKHTFYTLTDCSSQHDWQPLRRCWSGGCLLRVMPLTAVLQARNDGKLDIM